MKKAMAILFSILCVISITGCGEKPQQSVGFASQEAVKTEKKTEYEVIEGIYTVGKNIDPGPYVVEVSDDDFWFVVFENKESYENFNVDRREKFPGIAAAMNGGTMVTVYDDDAGGYAYLNEGNILWAYSGSSVFKKFAAIEDTLYTGLYYVGRDVPAGNYKLSIPDEWDSSHVRLFENTDQYSLYLNAVANGEAGALGFPPETCMYANNIYDDSPVMVGLEDGMVMTLTSPVKVDII